MDEKEFERFENQIVHLRTVSINEMLNSASRTLLLGTGRHDETVHVYIDQAAWEIHILRYVTVGAGANEKVLMLSHSRGQNGGVSSNAHFVPEKGHYPEFCDYEFCTRLRAYGVSLRFTKFDSQRHTLAKQHGGYAAPIWTPDLPRATSLRTVVQLDSSKFENAEVLRGLLQEACVLADVPFVVVNDDVLVADCDVPQVVGPANALLSSMALSARQDPAEIMKAICAATMRMPVPGCMDDYNLEQGGNYVFSFMFDEASVLNDLPDVTYYDAKDYGSALLGRYAGAQYLIMYEYADWDGIQGKVHVNLYGPVEKFIADMTSRYQLVPAAKD